MAILGACVEGIDGMFVDAKGRVELFWLCDILVEAVNVYSLVNDGCWRKKNDRPYLQGPSRY